MNTIYYKPILEIIKDINYFKKVNSITFDIV